MKKIFLAGIILIIFSCKKNDTTTDPANPVPIAKCGTISDRPTLDSFVYPTYYITMMVTFSDGNKLMHIHDNVTGDHDGSWFLNKYDKDSSFCFTP